jgi:putative transferase (TIGR04331 family)
LKNLNQKINKHILICTGLIEKWPNKKNGIIFLGEWCLKYQNKDKWHKLNYSILPYHWQNKNKRKLDYNYLESLHEGLILKLTSFLNKHHNTNHSNLFWRIILGPWLMIYLSSIFDRYEMLKFAFSEGLEYNCEEFISDSKIFIPYDFKSFNNLMASDEWNYNVYQRLLNYFIDNGLYTNQIGLIGRHNGELQTSITRLKKTLLDKIISIFDKFLFLFAKENKIFFFNSYFPIKTLYRLHKKLNLNFSLYSNIFLYNRDFKINYKIRKVDLGTLKQNINFENFILKNLLTDIPKSYLECFTDINNKLLKIPNKPSYIVTAGSYWDNDLFKIWAARLIDTNFSKLIVLEHGGGFVHCDNIFKHESKISKTFVSWVKPYLPNQIQLPPSKYVGKKFKYKSGSKLLIIGTEENRYAYKASSTPISSLTLISTEMIVNLIKTLNSNLIKNIQVRPYNNSDGWMQKDRINDMIKNVIFLDSIPFKKIFNNTKLIVCTHPQTSYTESLLTGFPTILLIDKNLYDFIDSAEQLATEMFDNNLIFYNTEEASKFINSTWNDIDRWWNSDNVRKCLKRYFIECIQLESNSIEIWSNYFINLKN